MRHENVTNSMERHLSSDADSSLDSQENAWLFESRKLIAN
jgi:hypothetical protein